MSVRWITKCAARGLNYPNCDEPPYCKCMEKPKMSLADDIKVVREILIKHFNRPESLIDIDLARIDVLVDQLKGGSLVKNHEAVDRILKLAAIGEQIHPARLTRILSACEEMEKALVPFAKIDVDFIPKGNPFRDLIFKARECLKKVSEQK